MGIQKIASEIASSNIVKKHIQKSGDSSKFLARTLLLTSVSKDVFAYALRVNNTMQNKDIPEDKKQFTAKMDAASGVATAITQIGTGLIVSSEKFQDFFTDKLFKSLKDSPKELKHAKTAFNAVSTLVLASVLAKRILTPLIASKLASADDFNPANEKTGERESVSEVITKSQTPSLNKMA